jgi:sulfur relay (sulfurtransferase) complex TusBCD TusD component (DsrE family)
MKILLILNDPPYGNERCYNALRLANALLKTEPRTEITIFLMADAVACAKKASQTTSLWSTDHLLHREAPHEARLRRARDGYCSFYRR